MTPAVSVKNLTKVFRLPTIRRREVVAVRNLSLEVAPGEVYGLIGPNGSGKSTTMKVLLGLIQPTKGDTSVFGKDSRLVESRADVGFLPENPYFYKHLTALETLRFYGRLCGLKSRQIRERSEKMLALTGLEDARDRRLGGFSKGMLQRIGLAQAMLPAPRLVVLDEPTAGVDPVGSRGIRDLIFDLKKRGMTVILSSHLLEQVQEVCDRVGIIFHGRMECEGRLDELMAVENQTEMVLENASPELLAKLRKMVKEDKKARLCREGHPRTTLEKLFLETINEEGGTKE